MKAFIPSLSSSHDDIRNPEDLIKYLTRHYVYAPKNINDTFRNLEVSFNYDVAIAQDDKNLLCNRVEEVLTSLIQRHFTDAASIDVSATHEEIDERSYSVKISIVVMVDGEVYSLDGNIFANSDGTINFDLG
jgi:hypothetical protein